MMSKEVKEKLNMSKNFDLVVIGAGPGGYTALELAVDGFASQGKATPHDVVVSKAVARVLTGGDTDMLDVLSEDDMTTLERSTLMTLIRNPASLDRTEHMLTTGKPLRN